MKTWQVFAVVAAIVGAGWLLFRRRSSTPIVPGGSTLPGSAYDTSSTGGPPTSVNYTPADFARAQTEAPNDPVTQQALANFYHLVSIAQVAPSTGPATESLRGRAHF